MAPKKQHIDLARIALKELKVRLGGGWSMLTPEVREAVYMQSAVAIVRTWECGENETAVQFQARAESLLTAFEATVRPDDFAWTDRDTCTKRV